MANSFGTDVLIQAQPPTSLLIRTINVSEASPFVRSVMNCLRLNGVTVPFFLSLRPSPKVIPN